MFMLSLDIVVLFPVAKKYDL